MKLSECRVNEEYLVDSLTLPEPSASRLRALGLSEGVPVRIAGRKQNGTVILKVRGIRLAAGPKIAAGIELLKLPA